jgi:hypothetical protein
MLRYQKEAWKAINRSASALLAFTSMQSRMEYVPLWRTSSGLFSHGLPREMPVEPCFIQRSSAVQTLFWTLPTVGHLCLLLYRVQYNTHFLDASYCRVGYLKYDDNEDIRDVTYWIKDHKYRKSRKYWCKFGRRKSDVAPGDKRFRLPRSLVLIQIDFLKTSSKVIARNFPSL